MHELFKFQSAARSSTRTASLAALIVCLAAMPAAADPALSEWQRAVSAQTQITPASQETGLFIQLGTTQLTAEELAELIAVDGKRILRLTSISAYVAPQSVPVAGDYADLAIAACDPNGSVRGFGAGRLSVAGGNSVQVNFDAGLVVDLFPRERLCVLSTTRSTAQARVHVHGALQDRL